MDQLRQIFSESEARTALENTVSKIQSDHGGTPVIVSELMNIGVNRIAYEFTENNGYETYGFSINGEREQKNMRM